MSNLSTFEVNVIHALRGAALSAGDDHGTLFDEAETIFLRWKERDVGKSERCALEWCTIAPFLSKALPAAMMLHSKVPADRTIADLRKFIRERHERHYFPGN